MATTLRSNVASTSFQPATRPQNAILGYPFSVAVASVAAGLTINSVIILGKIPKDCTLLSFVIDCPDLDTDGTGAVSVSVGDAQTADLFLATTTAFKSARTVTSSGVITASSMLGTLAGTLPKRYTQTSDLRLTVTVASLELSAAVTIKGHYLYSTYPKYRDPGQ